MMSDLSDIPQIWTRPAALPLRKLPKRKSGGVGLIAATSGPVSRASRFKFIPAGLGVGVSFAPSMIVTGIGTSRFSSFSPSCFSNASANEIRSSRGSPSLDRSY